MLIRQASVPHRPVKRVPACWLMTDARLGRAMPHIAAHMPPRSAIVVRPYALAAAGRTELIRALRRIARAKRHLLLLSGAGAAPGFDGRHAGRGASTARKRRGFTSMPVHDSREAAAALRARADAVLISPVWPTRSHAGAPAIGLAGFVRLASAFGGRAVALGGVTRQKFRGLRYHGATGWAAIDAWSI